MNTDCGRCRSADDSDEDEGEEWSVENSIDDGLFLTCGRKCQTYDDREDERDDVLVDEDVWTGCADDSDLIAGTLPPTSVDRVNMRPPAVVRTVSKDFQAAHPSYGSRGHATGHQSRGRRGIDSIIAMTMPTDQAVDLHASRAMPTRVLIGSKEPLPTAAVVPRTPAQEDIKLNTEMSVGAGQDSEMHTVMTIPTMMLSHERQEHQIGSPEPLPTATFGEFPLQTATFGSSAAQHSEQNIESLPTSLAFAQNSLPSIEALPTFSSLPTSPLAAVAFPESQLLKAQNVIGDAMTQPMLGASALPTATFG